MPGTSLDCGALEVAEVPDQDGFFVYPNPTAGRLVIEGTASIKGELSILSMDGRLVRKEKLGNSSRHHLNLDLPKGLYMLRLVNHHGSTTRQIVVQ